MDWTIRRATPADAAAVAEFNRRLAEESEGKALDRAALTAGVRAALDDPAKGLYFVAEQDGQLLGQLMVTTEWSDWRNGWFWWVQSVYVVEKSRRRGVFQSLYEHVLAGARADPAAIGLRLYVDRENHAARRTYARLGMAETEYLLLERYPL
jgi:GNAT superfamily N-acetyltransferase